MAAKGFDAFPAALCQQSIALATTCKDNLQLLLVCISQPMPPTTTGDGRPAMEAETGSLEADLVAFLDADCSRDLGGATEDLTAGKAW